MTFVKIRAQWYEQVLRMDEIRLHRSFKNEALGMKSHWGGGGGKGNGGTKN
jgi:hypothetical protein